MKSATRYFGKQNVDLLSKGSRSLSSRSIRYGAPARSSFGKTLFLRNAAAPYSLRGSGEGLADAHTGEAQRAH